jgi:hypothetical protein
LKRSEMIQILKKAIEDNLYDEIELVDEEVFAILEEVKDTMFPNIIWELE